jgi:hypothetical protein
MDIQASYEKVIKEIAADHRALIRYKQDELEFLNEALKSGNDREKILCLIDHSAIPWSGFASTIIECLNQDLPPDQIVFALNCARKHIITASGQKGQRLKFDFLEVLKKHLHSKDPLVVEWALRTIEECGSQGIYFLSELDKIKPPPWKWFNQHQRSVREIIAMLERRWGTLERTERT